MGVQTDKQKVAQAVYLVELYGSLREASRQTDIAFSTLQGRYEKRDTLTKKELEDFEPIAIPDGFRLKGTSTLFGKDGKKKLQWQKTTADLDRQKQMLLEAVKAMTAKLPKEKANPLIPVTVSDLLSCYILTDYHIGQLAWAEETGQEWNTKLAEDLLVKWFGAAIAASPNSKTAILAQLGDFLHFDNHEPVTPTSKHILDADARFAKIVAVAVRAIRRIVAMLLEKHERVHIVMAEGNHDISASIWLRALFADKYADEKRVTVDTTHTPFYVYEHGKTSLFFHHGHKANMGQVSNIFAGNFREIYGRTKYSYAHMGHYHHVASKEDHMMIVEQHPTLAARDAHSARLGYSANRGAAVITYSKDHGEVSRAIIRPEMVL